MRHAHHIPIALISVLSASCGVVGDDHIDGPYRRIVIDVTSDASVYYCQEKDECIGRGPDGVFATGFNASYVTAARHPGNDRSVTEFFYIDRAVDGFLVDPSVSVKGPFTPEAFAAERTRLK